MVDDLLADELKDVELDEDRQIHVGPEGDFAQTSGIKTVQQSVAISAGSVLRPLIGEPATGPLFEDINTELTEILQDDPQIEDVKRVQVQEVNRTTGTITVRVFCGMNNEFEIQPTVQL